MLFGTTHAFNQPGSAGIIIWSCVLVLLLAAGFMLVMRMKRRLQNDEFDSNPSASAGFTLSDLRRLHREGVMSDEEFEMAKAKIVDAARRAASRNELGRDSTRPSLMDRMPENGGDSGLSDVK